MEELGFVLFFLAYWFVVPYVLGTLFFKRLQKKWSWLSGKNRVQRIMAYGVFLLCALIGWLIEMLVLAGVKMIS